MSCDCENGQLIQDLTAASICPKVVPGYQPFVLIPEGYSAKTLASEHERPLPDHIIGSMRFNRANSFSEYISRFKLPGTMIFADATDVGAVFVAVLDYHLDGATPSRGSHLATFIAMMTPEWKAWLGNDGVATSQEGFLGLLRRWGNLIISHTDADLLEIASTLDFTMEGQVSSHIERVKGGRKFLVNETVEGSATLRGKNVTLPDSFTLNVPIFEGGASFSVDADILYRPKGGALTITFELRRPHLAVRQAVDSLVMEVEEATGLKVLHGARA